LDTILGETNKERKMVNLDDRKFLQELRYKAIARAHNTPNLS